MNKYLRTIRMVIVLLALAVTIGCSTGTGNKNTFPLDNDRIMFFKDKAIADYIVTSDCEISFVEDETTGTVLKVVAAGDKEEFNPKIELDYAAYMKKLELGSINTKELKYVVIRMKIAGSNSDEISLGYCAEGGTISEDTIQTTTYDNEKEGWQSVIYNLSETKWQNDTFGKLSITYGTEVPAGTTLYLDALGLATNAETAIEATEYQLGFCSNLEVKETDVVEHVKQTAEFEDSTVNIWFDHITEKTGQADIKPSGRDGYTIRLAKNEISSAQFFLAPETDRTFYIELDTLTHEDGNSTLDTSIYYTYYHSMKDDAMMPDAIPPLQGPIEVAGGTSQGFVIKAKSVADSKAGLYSADIRVYDNETNKCIKLATIYAYVWDFTLTDYTSLTVVANLHPYGVHEPYNFEGDRSYYYINYYNYLLDNRVCSYHLPVYESSDQIGVYLDNPRVRAFTLEHAAWAGEYSTLWNKIKDNQEWMDKLFVYKVDEPTNMDHLEEIKRIYEDLSRGYPDVPMISPFFVNIDLNVTVDQITFMADYLKFWCTKIDAYTPRSLAPLDSEDYDLSYMQSERQDKRYGTFKERMETEVANGDTLWTYFCAQPAEPYANWMANGDGVEPIITAWQCKMLDITGQLFWGCMTTDYENLYSDVTGTPAWGDGTIIYTGAPFGIDYPVGTLRLEQIRDGVEDYEYLVMLEEIYGEEVVDELVSLVTTSVVTFTTDDDYLAAVRVMIGDMLEKGIKEQK